MFESLHNDVIYSHILTKLPNPDLWNMMNINRNLKELTKKYVDNRAIHNINNVFVNIFADQPFSVEQFREYLKINQSKIRGRFLIRSILNETFSASIRIYNTSEYNTNQPFKKISGFCELVYVLDNKDNTQHLDYNKFKEQNIDSICNCNKYQNSILELYKNEYWFDGQDNIKVNNYFFVLNKIITLNEKMQSEYHYDIEYYLDNKFQFRKSQLYLHFIDYLQQYTNKLITGSYYNCIEECYYTIDEDTFSCKLIQINNGQDSLPEYDYRNIVDDIRCLHFDKWNNDRTICDKCYVIVDDETTQCDILDEGYSTTTIDDITIHHCSCGPHMFLQYLSGDNISAIIKKKYNLSGYQK